MKLPSNKNLVWILVGLFILDIVLTILRVGYLGLYEENSFGRYIIETYSIWLLPIFVPVSIMFTVLFVPWLMKKIIKQNEQYRALTYYYLFCICAGIFIQSNNVYYITKVMI